jgi:molybdopterin synthase catalytic subunit
MAESFAQITDLPIDRAELEAFARTDADGALVVFEGIIRDHDHGASVTSPIWKRQHLADGATEWIGL